MRTSLTPPVISAGSSNEPRANRFTRELVLDDGYWPHATHSDPRDPLDFPTDDEEPEPEPEPDDFAPTEPDEWD